MTVELVFTAGGSFRLQLVHETDVYGALQELMALFHVQQVVLDSNDVAAHTLLKLINYRGISDETVRSQSARAMLAQAQSRADVQQLYGATKVDSRTEPVVAFDQSRQLGRPTSFIDVVAAVTRKGAPGR